MKDIYTASKRFQKYFFQSKTPVLEVFPNSALDFLNVYSESKISSPEIPIYRVN
jgi:hypothetical protein